MPKECRDLITKDKEYCKTKPEFMKENCASTCGYCGMRKPVKTELSFVQYILFTCWAGFAMLSNIFYFSNYLGCTDALEICSSLVENNKDYCFSDRLFMKTNCPKSCDLCNGKIYPISSYKTMRRLF